MSVQPFFDQDETRVLNRVDNYIRLKHMSIKEKVMIAHIIAEHELESQQYDNEKERQIIIGFQRILELLIPKL